MDPWEGATLVGNAPCGKIWDCRLVHLKLIPAR